MDKANGTMNEVAKQSLKKKKKFYDQFGYCVKLYTN